MTKALERELAEQVRYYRVRAPEYDAWAERHGEYDRGSLNHGWHVEKRRLQAALDDFEPTGSVLEIAGGTGAWTERLLRSAASLTVVDAAPEAIDQSRRRLDVDAARVEYHARDFFEWDPPSRYDVVFFSYWLSHVPPARFEMFWDRVAECLAPDGRIFLIDNLASVHASRLDPEIDGGDEATVLRPAPDGNLYRIWKVLWHPLDLERALDPLGWSVDAFATGTYFMWAEGRRSTTAASA